MSARIWFATGLSALGSALVVFAAVAAESPNSSIELFAAIEAGQLEVKFIPRDARRARVVITNKTERPLNVQLPEVFAAVPVLAQFQPGPVFPPNNNRNNNNQNNANQVVGGGVNQPGGGGNGNFRGQNFFNVPAEATRMLKVRSVCLEHGKPEPRAVVPYRLVPLEEVTDDASLAIVLGGLVRGEHGQKAAQAAAWYMMGDLDWSQLASKTVRRPGVQDQPYFSHAELAEAKAMVESARSPSQSPKKAAAAKETAGSGLPKSGFSLGFASRID